MIEALAKEARRDRNQDAAKRTEGLREAEHSFALLMIGISAYYSWTSDFQSQGRYLFPILPMVAVGLESSRTSLKPRIILALIAVCFTLSAYSFIFTALWEISKGS